MRLQFITLNKKLKYFRFLLECYKWYYVKKNIAVRKMIAAKVSILTDTAKTPRINITAP